MLNLNELSKEIRNVRLAKNLSMEEVSKQAGITRMTLSEIENANPNCAFGSYLKIMSILDIDLSINISDKPKQRKRATRKILKSDKHINRWIVLTIELYANHINKSSDDTYKHLEDKGLIDLLYNDYEDLHGMSIEYINDYLDGCFKEGEL